MHTDVLNPNPAKPTPERRSALLDMLVLLGTVSSLTACSSLLGSAPQAPLTSYALDTDAPAGQARGLLSTDAGPSVALAQLPVRLLVLLLDQPQAAAGFDSARMVYQRQPQTLETYTQSAWVDTPARMLAPLLLRTLQSRTSLRAVLLAPSPARADLRLQTSVLRLEQDFLQHPSRVHFALQATLSDQRTRTVLGWKRFETSQSADSDDAAGGAAAASLAVQSALQQLALFVEASVAALPQAGVAAP
jgi:cholesterol transport system auxiliary component